jgi:hypothetical protein
MTNNHKSPTLGAAWSGQKKPSDRAEADALGKKANDDEGTLINWRLEPQE